MTTVSGVPYWMTDVSDVENDQVYVRGYKLGELIGRLPFAAMTYLLVRGRIPTRGESRMMDAILCSVLDYSLYKPGTVAARYVVSANPSMQVGMAVASLAVGRHTLAPDEAGRFIQESYTAYCESDAAMDAFARTFVDEYIVDGQRLPGLGHPNFRYTDPRAQRLKEVAQQEGCWCKMCDWFEAVHRAFTQRRNRPDIPINDIGMLAAIMSSMGFTPDEMNGVALISTLPGVIAHVSEEMQSNTRIRIVPDEVAHYSRRRENLERDLAEAGWD